MSYLFKRSRTKRPNSTKAWKRTLHTNNCVLLLKTLGFWLLFIPNTTHSFANLLTHCAKCLGMVHRSFTSGFIYDLTRSNCSCRVVFLKLTIMKPWYAPTMVFEMRKGMHPAFKTSWPLNHNSKQSPPVPTIKTEVTKRLHFSLLKLIAFMQESRQNKKYSKHLLCHKYYHSGCICKNMCL